MFNCVIMEEVKIKFLVNMDVKMFYGLVYGFVMWYKVGGKKLYFGDKF